MPSEALAAVFVKLDGAKVLMGGGLVCRASRRLAATPRRTAGCAAAWTCATRGGSWRSRRPRHGARRRRPRVGTMEVFSADTSVNDDLLRFISQRAPSLKILQLCLCRHVSNGDFAEAINGLPQLEELDVTFCSLGGNARVCDYWQSRPTT